jgi:RNA polymerase I-specific transcription-initiation factor
MAGMSQRYELQNAHSTKFLNYGHLGTITYGEENKGWDTLRVVKPQLVSDGRTETGDGRSAFPLRHLSSRVAYDGLNASPSDVESEKNDSDLGDIDEPSSRLTNTSNLAAETEIKTRNKGDSLQIGFSVLSGKQFPNRSTLITFGSAVSVGVVGLRSETVYVQILASVSSINAQSVRLVRIRNGTIQKPEFDVEASSLHVPCVFNEDQAYWTSSSGQIQQISFAATTGYSSTWMAARLQNSTTIFHPLLRREPVPPRCEISQSPFQALPSSALDTNPIVTIPILRTGGHPHADVCFHPKDHSRLALIDEHGNWSVWLVDGEHQESLHSRFWVTLLCFGKIWTWDHEKRLRTSLPYHDGWHRISWCIGSDAPSDLLFMSNRRTAALYKTSGDLLGMEDLQLGHAREGQCILDVQPSRVVPGHCFVLTSTRLLWLYCMDIESGKSVRAPGLPHVLLAWQHFRDRADRTLHLVVLETGLSRPQLHSQVLQMLTLGRHYCAYSISSCRSRFGVSIWSGQWRHWSYSFFGGSASNIPPKAPPP